MASKSKKPAPGKLTRGQSIARGAASPAEPSLRASGHIDNVAGGVLRGWTLLPQGSELDVYVDDQCMGTTVATASPGNAAKGSSACGFQFALPAAIIDGDEHKFEIRAAGQGQRSRYTITRRLTVSLFSDAPAKITGWLDGIQDGMLYGWHTAPTGSRLIVTIDAQYAGTTRNNIARDDVIAAGHASEPVGFEITIPEKLLDGAEHVFEVRAALTANHGEPLVGVLKTEKASTAKPETKRKTVAAVVCWDLGHNPAGRALVLVQTLERLYDEVHLIGPLFARFGGKVWAPIADHPKIRIIAEKVKTFAELETFQSKILKQQYDFVHMCKPRWPTLYLGICLAQHSECPIALDIDDYELSFFKDARNPPPLAGIVEKLKKDEVSPIDLEATLLAHTIIEFIPAITVSNIALQKKFGGTILRHARDETDFNPARFDRRQIRHSFGYGPDDKVVLFLGTIRRHKGVLKIAQAIARLKRADLKLCLIGPIDEPDLQAEIRAALGKRVSFHKGVPFSMLAATTLLADLVCLPQELDSEVSQFQIPAKLTDALAMGIPVIVEDLPPFSDLSTAIGVYIRKDHPLDSLITKALKNSGQQKQLIRDLFLLEFSTAANADNLSRLIRANAKDPKQWSAKAHKIGIRNNQTPLAVNQTSAAISRNRGRDIVFLWKQNDSGLFGRRSDMVMKHLLKQGFAGRILQFDASMSLDNFNRLLERAEQNSLSADGMVYRNVVSRHLGLSHELQVSRYTLLHDNKKRSLLGRALPAEEDMPDVLRSLFKAENLSQEALLWTCPVTFDFDWFTTARDFKFKIADLIDDQRSFTTNESYKKKLNDHYETAMASADVVFANCAGVAQRFSDLIRNPIHIISNGAEKISVKDIQAIDIFAGRKDVFRIGYVGNLRDRIDIDLLARIAKENSRWQLILVGPTGGSAAIEALGRYSNITLLGPQRYEDSVRIAASFDVAVIPHTIGELTASMNPLKLYLYQMLGLPVISTEVENMTGANKLVQVARSHKEFLKLLKNAASAPKRRRTASGHVGENVYWDENVASMIKIARKNLKLDQ